MTNLAILHRTSYRYRSPVELGPHRLLLRPRDTCDVRLKSFTISTSPEASLSWAHDVFGNAVATAVFAEATDELVIEGRSEVKLQAEAWPVFDIAASAISYPFHYSEDERTDLGALTLPRYPDPAGRTLAWAQGFIGGYPTDTLAMLKDLNAGISSWVSYQERDDEGTQSPVQTLDCGCGSCRDLAVLLVEAARCLGFGARIISGYLHDPHESMIGSSGPGSTHAWAEIFIPGAGWIAFDPTNRSVGNANLVPVAVARNIEQTIPVAGTFAGGPGLLEKMTVEVAVTDSDRPA